MDYHLRPKMLVGFVRDLYEPVAHLVLTEVENRDAWLSNALDSMVQGKVLVSVVDVWGDTIWKENLSASAGPFQSLKV